MKNKIFSQTYQILFGSYVLEMEKNVNVITNVITFVRTSKYHFNVKLIIEKCVNCESPAQTNNYRDQ